MCDVDTMHRSSSPNNAASSPDGPDSATNGERDVHRDNKLNCSTDLTTLKCDDFSLKQAGFILGSSLLEICAQFVFVASQ